MTNHRRRNAQIKGLIQILHWIKSAVELNVINNEWTEE